LPDQIQSILIQPGGLVTAKPAHLIGDRGAAPYTTVPTLTYDGFQNLVNINGEVAWALLNGTSDEKATHGIGTLLLGGNTKGTGNCVDCVEQKLLSWIVDNPIETGVGNPSSQKLVVNGEIVTGGGGTDGTRYGAYGQVFTTAGSVTVTAGSNIIVGAGTAWTTDVLTANYAVAAANLSRNKIEPGDVIAVGAAGVRVYFRVIAVTDDTHLVVFPTPTLGNPAIGAGKAYSIFRTGYGSYSRIETIIVGTSDTLLGYYAGNSGLSGANGHTPGTVEAIAIFEASNAGPAADHYQAPKSVDSAGTFITDIQADDVIYDHGFLLYGAGSAISWSAGGFPSAVPFGPTDFPAKNIEVLNRTGRFVTFERIGDQVIGLFEDSFWLCTRTGSVPEYAFYKLPELLSVEHAARAEPCGIANGLAFGRPSCSGRGAFYYVSNRGIEQCSGGLSEEESRQISDSIPTIVGDDPYFLSWDNAFDLVFFRRFGPADLVDTAPPNVSLVYAAATQQWSTVNLGVNTNSGAIAAAITAGVSPRTQVNDQIGLIHLGYYETLSPGGTPGTNGGDVRHLTNGIDTHLLEIGLVDWIWNTPVVPLGLDYPDFQFGGFILDAMHKGPLSGGSPPTITWTMYAGTSPYNLIRQQAPVALSFAGPLAPIAGTTRVTTTWTGSDNRQGQKTDLAFIQFRFNCKAWVQIARLILFDSRTQARR
jgi:hypothetical protein